MVVLIGGVEEVSQSSPKEVTQAPKILFKMEFKRIWVTSRNSVKELIETEFH